MMDPNGNQLPYPTISYANGPGFNDHFDNVRIAISVSRADIILFFTRSLDFGRTSQK